MIYWPTFCLKQHPLNVYHVFSYERKLYNWHLLKFCNMSQLHSGERYRTTMTLLSLNDSLNSFMTKYVNFHQQHLVYYDGRWNLTKSQASLFENTLINVNLHDVFNVYSEKIAKKRWIFGSRLWNKTLHFDAQAASSLQIRCVRFVCVLQTQAGEDLVYDLVINCLEFSEKIIAKPFLYMSKILVFIYFIISDKSTK